MILINAKLGIPFPELSGRYGLLVILINAKLNFPIINIFIRYGLLVILINAKRRKESDIH